MSVRLATLENSTCLLIDEVFSSKEFAADDGSLISANWPRASCWVHKSTIALGSHLVRFHIFFFLVGFKHLLHHLIACTLQVILCDCVRVVITHKR